MDDSVKLAALIRDRPELSAAIAKIQDEIMAIEKDKVKAAMLLKEALDSSLFRPRGWKSNSNAAYYKKKYAELVKGWLIQLDKDREDKLIKARQFKICRRSLREMVSQAWEYLMEKDEEKERWRELRDDVEIRKAPDGVILCLKNIAQDNLELTSVKRKDKGEDNKWKEELDEFIANAEDGKKLVIEELRLNDNQVEYIKSVCSMTPGLFPKDISSVRIEIIKNMSLWKRIQE